MSPADLIERLSASVAQYPLIALGVAIAGWLFSTRACPCTIPAGIGIVSYIGTHDDAAAASTAPAWRRRRGVLLSVAFFLGLVLALAVLGTVAAVIGRLVTRWDAAFALGAAAVTGVAGVATLFGPAIRRRVPDPAVRQRRGVTGAFIYGVLYSVATVTTSAGPLLLLLTVAAALGRPTYGAGLSLAYGVGRGLPFLVLGLFAGQVGRWLERFERARRPVEVLSGIALLGLAIYFVWLATLIA